MKVDVTTVGSFQKQLVFVVPHDQVESRLDQAYKRLAGQVKIAGFRPGKAPRKVLEAKFAPRVEADVANDLIQQSYRTAITENNIQPVGQPNLAESTPVADENGFRFTITVDVRPEIELSEWTGMDVVFPTVEVPAEAVDRAVKARLEGHARLEEVTGRPVQQGDLALVELVVRDGDEEVAREPGTMIRTEGDPYFPGVEPLVIGLEVGGEKQDRVAFPETARTASVQGRELDVTAKVLAIQSYRVPELTDELATELGYEGGTAGMRAAIEAQLRQGQDEMARNQARANLLEVIIAKNPFEVPAGMIEQSLKMLMDELRLQQALRTGRDPRTIGFNEAQVQDLRMRARFAAKAALILEWVAKREGIAVTDDDIESKYKQLAVERGQTPEAVKGWFQKENAAAELKERILEEKTLDWLLERANLVAPSEAAAAAPTTEAAPAAKGKSAPAAASSDDLSAAVEGWVDALKERLASGSYDDRLDALVEAETAGRNRKGALSAIEARRKEIPESSPSGLRNRD
jgi:trigger factor